MKIYLPLHPKGLNSDVPPYSLNNSVSLAEVSARQQGRCSTASLPLGVVGSNPVNKTSHAVDKPHDSADRASGILPVPAARCAVSLAEVPARQQGRCSTASLPLGVVSSNPLNKTSHAVDKPHDSADRASGIRTHDPLHPMQVRYQTALLPDGKGTAKRIPSGEYSG